MQITRKQIRAMILKEMADILPFRGPVRRGGGMGGELGGAEIFDFTPSSGMGGDPSADPGAVMRKTHDALLSGIKGLQGSLMSYGRARSVRRMSLEPEELELLERRIRAAAEQVMSNAAKISVLRGDIEMCADEFEDPFCIDALPMVDAVDEVLDVYNEDPGTARAGATRLSGILRMSSGLVSALEDYVETEI